MSLFDEVLAVIQNEKFGSILERVAKNPRIQKLSVRFNEDTGDRKQNEEASKKYDDTAKELEVEIFITTVVESLHHIKQYSSTNLSEKFYKELKSFAEKNSKKLLGLGTQNSQSSAQIIEDLLIDNRRWFTKFFDKILGRKSIKEKLRHIIEGPSNKKNSFVLKLETSKLPSEPSHVRPRVQRS